MCAPNEVIDGSLGMSTGFESSMAKLGDDESITDDGDYSHCNALVHDDS